MTLNRGHLSIGPPWKNCTARLAEKILYAGEKPLAPDWSEISRRIRNGLEHNLHGKISHATRQPVRHHPLQSSSLSPPLLTSMPASMYSPSLPRRGDAQSIQDYDERFGSSNNGVDGDGRPNQALYGLKLS